MCTFAAKKGAKWPVFDKVRELGKMADVTQQLMRHRHFQQVDVNGPATSDVYNFLKVSSGDLSDIQWNFGKFLVSREGKVVKRFLPTVPPTKLVADIERL